MISAFSAGKLHVLTALLKARENLRDTISSAALGGLANDPVVVKITNAIELIDDAFNIVSDRRARPKEKDRETMSG